ncbi:MAG TPA: hypothetical protein VHT05_11040 [Candidatus Elarobacter sp.]|jgi:hypothetical protein|nr:hypothetical protein [Candidatus Elarobacter sp.]
MLDALDLPAAMGINNSNELFHDVQSRAVATSALVFPVFVAPNLKNFSGSGIDLQTVHLFRMMIEELLVPRLEHASRALIVPLGVVAASGVRYAVTNGRVAPERVLVGMPHPSGSNGHRHRQFRENAEALRRRISSWFG